MRLKKIYEDIDVEVYKAPTEEELEKLVKDTLTNVGRPMSWRELRERFSGIAGEDRLRKVLIKLIERDEVLELPDGTFALPGMEQNYIPRRNAKRVRPLVPLKFRARWGTMAARLRKMGVPLGEIMKEIRKSEVFGEEVSEETEEEEEEE